MRSSHRAIEPTRWDGAAQLEDNVFDQVADTRLQWESMTTGGLARFDALLTERDAGTLRIDTPLVQCRLPVGEIGYDDTVFEAGALGRRLRVLRVPDVYTYPHVRIERVLPVPPSAR